MKKRKAFAFLLLAIFVVAAIRPDSVQALVGQWSTNGNNMYYTDGMIGIGTSTPTKQLDVRNGSINVSGKLGAGGKDADTGYPTGWGGGVHTWDLYVEGALGVGSQGSVGVLIKNNGDIKAGRLGVMGMDPTTGYPSGWGGGVHAWDIYSESVIGVGSGGTVNAIILNDGTIKAKQIYVTNSVWPDYVFEKDYKLKSLSEVEAYVNKYKHLPGIESADDIKKHDENLGDIQKKQMEKIEELTLYMIKMDRRVNDLEEQNKLLKEEIRLLKK